jgi:hypothetical protein
MRARALLAAVLGAALLAPNAIAAPAASPLGGLAQARSELGTLAGSARSAAARGLLSAAQSELSSATAPSLWLDPSHAIAPPYGASVFAHSRAALAGLERLPSSAVPSNRIASVEASILAADRSLAAGSIRQAAGGPGGLLFRAGGMILSGDRWAETSRVDLGAVQYGTAWRDAFQALTELVVVRATLVSPAALGRAAENALGGAATAPVGVRALAGRAPLSLSAKPEVLFVGAESCRFCAMERWGLVAALSQFGIFSNLHLSQSATTAPLTVRSFTFHGSSYQSPYLSFDPVELSSVVPRSGGGYQPLERLAPAQRALVRALDAAAVSPFVDVANQSADVGATVSPAGLGGASWSALAGSISRAKTHSGQAIAATAEVLTAEICRATAGAPASVCASNVVQEYASRLARFGGRGGGCALQTTRRRVAGPVEPHS